MPRVCRYEIGITHTVEVEASNPQGALARVFQFLPSDGVTAVTCVEVDPARAILPYDLKPKEKEGE